MELVVVSTPPLPVAVAVAAEPSQWLPLIPVKSKVDVVVVDVATPPESVFDVEEADPDPKSTHRHELC